MLTVCAEGKFRTIKNRRGDLCDMMTGFDADRHQLISCKQLAKYLWFSRNRTIEELKQLTAPYYHSIGARVCESCFGKLVNPQGQECAPSSEGSVVSLEGSTASPVTKTVGTSSPTPENSGATAQLSVPVVIQEEKSKYEKDSVHRRRRNARRLLERMAGTRSYR